MADATYQPKIYHKQGGTELHVASGGYIKAESGGYVTVESGGYLSIENGGNLTFYGTTLTARQFEIMALNTVTITTYNSSVSVLSVNGNMTPGYGVAIFSLATGCSKASIRLPNASKYAMLTIQGYGLTGDANISLINSGQSCIGIHGSDMSSFDLSAAAYMEFRCDTDGEWTVVNQNGSVTEHTSA